MHGQVRQILKAQLVLSAEEADGTPVDATGACLHSDKVPYSCGNNWQACVWCALNEE